MRCFVCHPAADPSVSRSTKPKTEAAARGFLHLFLAVTTEIIVSPVRSAYQLACKVRCICCRRGNRFHRVRPSLAFDWRCAIARRFFRPVPLLCPCLSKEKKNPSQRPKMIFSRDRFQSSSSLGVVRFIMIKQRSFRTPWLPQLM